VASDEALRELFATILAMMLWSFVALGILLLPMGVIFAFGTRPAVFPYAMLLWNRGFSVVGPLLKNRAVKKIDPDRNPKDVPNDVFKIAGSFTLENAKRLRDALVELDNVPTIANGLKELGYKNMVECFAKRDYYKRKSPYTHPLQQPYIFFPGIEAKAFYDPNEFEFTKVLEDNFDVIRAEVDAVLADGGRGFKSFRGEYATEEKYWNTFNLWIQGRKIEENCARVPRTTEILESLPRFEKAHIIISALNPRSHIPTHVGAKNGVLRSHLPLIIPPGCRIKVGDEVREWEEGKVIVFDDSFWHEVWNDSDQLRVLLFFNFWHPSIAEEDIAAIERFAEFWDEEHPLARAYRKAEEEPRPHHIAGGPVPPARAS